MNKFLAAATAAVMALAPSLAHAATFVLHAATHSGGREDGSPIVYDGVLSTDDGIADGGGTTYAILGATGTASYDGLTSTIDDGFGSFTLTDGAVTAMDSLFFLSPYFGIGSIQKGSVFNFIAVSEVAGPVEVLEITPQAGAVPEPATWAMMLFGFGAAGYVLRRRQPVAARIRFA